MNLFNNPTINELSTLICHHANFFGNYDLLVDHDGEVLIELSGSISSWQLNKYRFYFRNLHGKANIGIIAARNLIYINSLYKNIFYCWKKDLRGSQDYEDITDLRKLTYLLEEKSISLYSNISSGKPGQQPPYTISRLRK